MGGSSFDSDDNVVFVNPSHGKLVNKKKNISWYQYQGQIVGIEVKDKVYEQHPYKQLQIKLKDTDPDSKEIVYVCTNLQSWYAFGFFQRADRIDVTKPVTLGCSGPEDGGTISFCWVKQGQYTIKKNPEFPKPIGFIEGEHKRYDWAGTNKASLQLVEKLQQDLKAAGITAPDPDKQPAPKPQPQAMDGPLNLGDTPGDMPGYDGDEELPF